MFFTLRFFTSAVTLTCFLGWELFVPVKYFKKKKELKHIDSQKRKRPKCEVCTLLMTNEVCDKYELCALLSKEAVCSKSPRENKIFVDITVPLFGNFQRGFPDKADSSVWKLGFNLQDCVSESAFSFKPPVCLRTLGSFPVQTLTDWTLAC